MTRLTITEARAALPDVVDRVVRGEEVVITRHGEPVAVVVRPDALRARRAAAALAEADALRSVLEEGARASLGATTPLTAQRAEEHVAEVHAGRARR